jgi:hypothetical protein
LSSLAAPGIAGLRSVNPFSFTGGSISFLNAAASGPQAGIYQGSVTNIALSPYPGASGGDPRNYLVAQANDDVVLNLNSLQTSFSLLWGSVDTYNQLQFIGPGGSQVVTGGDLLGIPTNGSTSAYVTISGLDPFYQIKAIDIGQPAFEFVPDPVPEPFSMTLLGVGLLGIGFIRHRRRNA